MNWATLKPKNKSVIEVQLSPFGRQSWTSFWQPLDWTYSNGFIVRLASAIDSRLNRTWNTKRLQLCRCWLSIDHCLWDRRIRSEWGSRLFRCSDCLGCSRGRASCCRNWFGSSCGALRHCSIDTDAYTVAKRKVLTGTSDCWIPCVAMRLAFVEVKIGDLQLCKSKRIVVSFDNSIAIVPARNYIVLVTVTSNSRLVYRRCRSCCCCPSIVSVNIWMWFESFACSKQCKE